MLSYKWLYLNIRTLSIGCLYIQYTVTHRWTTLFFWVSSAADATCGNNDVSIAEDRVDNTIRRECISPWLLWEDEGKVRPLATDRERIIQIAAIILYNKQRGVWRGAGGPLDRFKWCLFLFWVSRESRSRDRYELDGHQVYLQFVLVMYSPGL